MKKTPVVLSLIALTFLVTIPTSIARAADAEYQIEQETLVTESSKPTIRGGAEDISKIRLEIYKEGSTKRLFKSKEIRVREDEWSVKVSKKLADGTYTVNVYGDKKKIGSETLIVGDDVALGGSFSVSSIPLLSGGSTRAGMTVPVAYLQVRNTGSASTTITAFNLTQAGTADAKIVSTLEVVDDRSVTRWYTTGLPWKNNGSPAGLDYTLAPGEMRLYTIKATLGADAASQVGKNLVLDLTSITSNGKLTANLPIKGVAWTISQ